MNEIQVLNDDLINKIAAGEVVERPESIVKELIENAVDAGCKNITIELKDGGIQLISVTDDGKGMSPEDTPLAIKRHATSKISSVEDLFAVHTLGFRGEALASIASVSRFCILTRRKKSPVGCKLEVLDSGEIETVPWSGADGTTIIVKDLFYNIPARKAFLKSASYEFGHILELVQSYALSLPQIGLILIHNGREVFRAKSEPSFDHDFLRGEDALRSRMKLIVDEELVGKLIYAVDTKEACKIEMLLSPPGCEKSTSRYIYSFVNGRWVKDKTIRFGVLHGYHSHLLKGKFPIALTHISIDPSLVDVNVHPSKTEVRFQYAKDIQTLISQTIRTALRAGAWAFNPPAQSPSVLQSNPDFDLMIPTTLQAESAQPHSANELFGSPTPLKNFGGIKITTKESPNFNSPSSFQKSSPTSDYARNNYGATFESTVSNSTVSPGIDWNNAEYIGSYGFCFLLFNYQNDFLVVDQHAFHERILFEKLTLDFQNMGTPQPLLFPEAIIFSATEYEKIKEHQQILFLYGIKLNFLEQNTIEVESVPNLLKKADLEGLLCELSGNHFSTGVKLSETKESHNILSTLACHAAIKSGEQMDLDSVQTLLRDASKVDFHLNCPHGRRVLRQFDRKTVGSWFDRI